MRGFVGNTDFDWYSFLKERQPVDEVNFWQPSGGDSFRAIEPGEPFFFRLKKPHYAIAGFGLFARHEIVPARLAWDAFGPLNGAHDFDEMCLRIERYRRGQPADPLRQYRIGCLMISGPTFFGEADWVQEPARFSRNIVRGAGYDLGAGEGRRMWEACLERVRARRVPMAAEAGAELDRFAGRPRHGQPQIILPRLGQGTFRVAVTQAYERSCAVTREHSLPVLEAAHIKSWGEGGPHRVSNGLLLRADVHRLFDAGYVTVTPDLRFQVSRRLKDEFENGRVYYAVDGHQIAAPSSAADRPDPECLRWHNDHVFEKWRNAG